MIELLAKTLVEERFVYEVDICIGEEVICYNVYIIGDSVDSYDVRPSSSIHPNKLTNDQRLEIAEFIEETIN